MHQRLFVSNLSATVTEDELRALCAQYGEVNSLSIGSGGGGRQGTIAFVEMATDIGARGVLENLNGFRLAGRKLRIDEARARAKSGASPRGG